MLNNYDLQAGLVSIDPIGFLVGMGIVVLLGWLVSKK